MSWSYDPTTLATSAKNRIRLEAGDTDTADQLLQDEEINHALDVEANEWGAAARCCEIIARGFLRKADVSLGRSMQVQWAKAAQQYYEMAKELRQKALGSALPYVGGRKQDEKDERAADSTLVQPLFTKDMHRNFRGERDPDWEE